MKAQLDLQAQAASLRCSLIRPKRLARSCVRFLRPRPLILSLLRKDEQGQALVEMALILPALLAVMTAIFAFGAAYSNELTLTNAVGAGAQQLQLIRTTTSDPCADTLAAIKQAAPTLNPSKINLSISLNGAAPISGANCPSATSTLANDQGDPVTVTATYPISLPIMNFKTSSGWVLSATVTEYEY